MFSELSKPPWEFDVNDLVALVADKIPEGLHLDYKSVELLGNRDNTITTLTKEVSAFNNAEGGTIFLGIRETKEGRLTYPKDVDHGVASTEFTVTWLNQLIQSNIDPSISGLRVHAVPLSEPKQNRVAFVIYVPQGKRAVQAKDCKYYQRQEDRSVPMRDFQVRDVNNRADGPDLHLELALPNDGRLSLATDSKPSLNATVVVRNASDILGDNALFRVMVSEPLSPSLTRHWREDAQIPMMKLFRNGQQVREAHATSFFRIYKGPEDLAIYSELGPTSLGTLTLSFQSIYENVPHLEPVVLMATAPRMQLRTWQLVLSTDGGSVKILEWGMTTFRLLWTGGRLQNTLRANNIYR